MNRDSNILDIQLFQISTSEFQSPIWTTEMWTLLSMQFKEKKNKKIKSKKKQPKPRKEKETTLSLSQSTFLSHFHVHFHFIRDRLLAQVTFKTGFSCHSALPQKEYWFCLSLYHWFYPWLLEFYSLWTLKYHSSSAIMHTNPYGVYLTGMEKVWDNVSACAFVLDPYGFPS